LSSPFIWIIQENYSIWHYSAGNSIPVDTVSITIYNKDKGIISENNNSTSVYLFWSASCSSCKKEFPYFSELALNYKDRKDIHFYTVLLEFNESDSVAFNREIRNNSHFKWAYALNGKVLYDRLKMNGVPHITIIDSQNNIRYNGRVSNRPWLYINHPDRFL
jgi:thiol-disulfide isomerase/thioredoxin